MQENDLEIYDAAPKRSGLLGALACAAAVIALLLLAVAVFSALLAFRDAALTPERISLAKTLLTISAAAAALGLLLAVVTFFLKRQKNGLAVVALVLAVVIFAISFGVIYAYNYLFAPLDTDDAFNAASDSDLHIRQPNEDGEIVRDGEMTIETLPPEDIPEGIDIEEVEWEYLSAKDIPDEAKAKMNTGKPINHSYLLDGADQISNFLLMGTDVGGASDSMIICSVDRAHKKIKLISIARDSYVLIPTFQTFGKLNYANCWGGTELTIATINYNYALNIADYISVDMTQLAELVDLAGGVDIELTEAESPYIRLPAGMQHLNGEQAVNYARLREIDTETARTGRQRKVLISLLNSALEMPLSDYPALIRACLGSCQTSFRSEDLLSLAAEVVGGGYTIEQYALIEHVDFWNGKLGKAQYYYLVYDLNRASDVLYRLIYEDLYVSGYMDPNEE